MISYSIFVVDDDPMVREGVTSTLERDYQVQAFPSADDAIARCTCSEPAF